MRCSRSNYSGTVFLSVFNINIRSYWYLYWIADSYWKYIEYWLLNLIYRALAYRNRALRSFKIRQISHQYRQRSDLACVVFNCSASCVRSRVSATTSTAISLPPAVIWLLNQLFKHSVRLIFVLLSFIRSHVIVSIWIRLYYHPVSDVLYTPCSPLLSAPTLCIYSLFFFIDQSLHEFFLSYNRCTDYRSTNCLTAPWKHLVILRGNEGMVLITKVEQV